MDPARAGPAASLAMRGARHRTRLALLCATAAVLTVLILTALPSAGPTRGALEPTAPVPGLATATTAVPSSASTLNLGISSTPGSICVLSGTNCSAGTGVARVQMTAIAYGSPTATWPNVQVAFVLETTAYDGVYYHDFFTHGLDPCASSGNGQGPLCEESNGDPFFMAHAGAVAEAIAAGNPHANVTFALVDFFATGQGDWSDGTSDGSPYHVDIPNFVNAAAFGPAVTSSLVNGVFGGEMYGDIGLDDNFLHSPSIVALYGTIIGSGLDWSPNAHHVIVLIGSTAPEDPMYRENYRVSPSFYEEDPQFERHPYGATCQSPYIFADGASPNCEGWVRAQDGNSKDSIAALAHDAPQCAESVGRVCTIDVIDLWDTPTDPYSPGWPTGISGGGPGGPEVVTDSSHILQAGCDLAAATGGSWDGPSFWTCTDGDSGDLTYVAHGPVFSPNTENPTLMRALSRIAFGPIYNYVAANHTNASMFRFVPFGSIEVAPDPQWSAACLQSDGFYLGTCQKTPTIRTIGGVRVYDFNWSTDPTTNLMDLGDQWTLSFDVVATGPPYATVPVDACSTPDCRAKGSVPVGGMFTWALYIPGGTDIPVVNSFPITRITVVPPPPPPRPSGLAPPPPPPPPVPPVSLAANPPPLAGGLAPVAQTSLGSLSVQATAAGLLGAGFTHVALKNRPIAQGIASPTGVSPRKSPEGRKPRRPPARRSVGRFV